MPLICLLGTQDLHWATIFSVSSGSYFFFPFLMKQRIGQLWTICLLSGFFVLLIPFQKNNKCRTIGHKKLNSKEENNIYKFCHQKKSWRLVQGPNYIPMELFSIHLGFWEYWIRKILEIVHRCHLGTEDLEANLQCTLYSLNFFSLPLFGDTADQPFLFSDFFSIFPDSFRSFIAK